MTALRAQDLNENWHKFWKTSPLQHDNHLSDARWGDQIDDIDRKFREDPDKLFNLLNDFAKTSGLIEPSLNS